MNELLATPALAWAANYLLHSTVLLGVAWLLETAHLVRSPRSREFGWRLAFFGALVSASAHTALPGLSLSGPPSLGMFDSTPPATIIEDAPNTEAKTANATISPPSPPARTFPSNDQAATPVEPMVPLAPLLLALWTGGAAFFLARLGSAAVRSARSLRSREVATSGRASERLRGLALRAGTVPPRLSIHGELPGPATLPGGEICLPRWADAALERRALDAMLAHELGHVVRRDPMWLLLANLVEALLFLQPLNRIARRRMAALAELNADAFGAQLVGDTRALAEALAQCAARLQQQARPEPVFGVAMASHRSPLMQRVERLLGGTAMQDRNISLPVRILALAGLLITVVFLPAFGARDGVANAGIFIGTSVSERNGHMEFEIGRPGYFLHVESEGEVEFNTEESDVAELAEGGFFRVREKQDGVLRELDVRREDDNLVHHYEVDSSKKQVLDAAGREWLARIIPEVLRNTTINMNERIDRIHARGGVDAVLEEMRKMEPGHALAAYAATLARKHELDDRHARKLLEMLREVGSDFELRESLVAIAESDRLTPSAQVQLLKAATTIDSDFEAAELLIVVTPLLALNDEMLRAWNEVVGEISSDFELRRALSSVFERREFPKAWKMAALRAAAENIGSDFELRSLLETASRQVGGDQDLVRLYIDALPEIGSDFEAREAVIALVRNASLDSIAYRELLDVLDDIGSDFEMLQAMLVIARQMPRDEQLVNRYLSLARDMANHERQQAERALD